VDAVCNVRPAFFHNVFHAYTQRLKAEATRAGLSMVTRHNRTVKKQPVAVLAQSRNAKLSFDDWLVDMGASQCGTTPVRLHLMSLRGPGFHITLITNVLDPRRLSPQQLLALYRRRWSIERMYLAMKAAEGHTWDEVSERIECSRGFVASWSNRFAGQRLAGLYNRHLGQVAGGL
jgi:hypothetical protein